MKELLRALGLGVFFVLSMLALHTVGTRSFTAYSVANLLVVAVGFVGLLVWARRSVKVARVVARASGESKMRRLRKEYQDEDYLGRNPLEIERVRSVVERQAGDDLGVFLGTRLYHDLGLAGMDVDDLFSALGDEFDVDIACNDGQHFFPLSEPPTWKELAAQYEPLRVVDLVDLIHRGYLNAAGWYPWTATPRNRTAT
jgi:hypothetical protein